MPKNKITPFDRYFSRPLKAIASLGALAADVSSEIFNAQIAGNQITVSGPNGGMNSIGAISDGHFTPRGNNSGTIIAQEIENGRLVNVSYQLSNYGDGSNTNVIDAGPVSAGQTVMSGSGLVANYQGPEGSVVTSSMINNVANDPSSQGLQVGVGYYPDSFFPTPNDDASAIYNPVVDTVFDIDDDSVRYLLHGSYVDVYQDPRINLPLVIDARTSDPHAVNVTFEGGTVNYQVPNSAIRAIDEDGQDVLVYPGDQRLGGGVVARPISVINHGRWNFETLIGEGPRIGEGYGVEIFSRNQYPVQSISNTQIRSPITEIREYNASDTNIINVPQGVGYVVINGDDQVGDPSLQINIPLDQPSVVSFESEVGTENSIVSVPGGSIAVLFAPEDMGNLVSGDAIATYPLMPNGNVTIGGIEYSIDDQSVVDNYNLATQGPDGTLHAIVGPSLDQALDLAQDSITAANARPLTTSTTRVPGTTPSAGSTPTPGPRGGNHGSQGHSDGVLAGSIVAVLALGVVIGAAISRSRGGRNRYAAGPIRPAVANLIYEEAAPSIPEGVVTAAEPGLYEEGGYLDVAPEDPPTNLPGMASPSPDPSSPIVIPVQVVSVVSEI